MSATDSDITTRKVDSAREDTEKISRQILDLSTLDGKVTEPGPSVAPCSGKDSDKFYVIEHAWSVYDVPVPELEQAMDRLKSELPKHGWEITKDGSDSSKAKSREILANIPSKKISASMRLLDRRGRSKNPSMISVHLNSTCLQVPDGDTVSPY
ncbi:hypothetical protein RCO28_36250 [Streptomyces sp. LHD-70]|uniref:hypothetical protein n=1 Tax=Streptomyces sp. LHD-70 TaxID=3072140 RepID=UPI00280F512D|nr:hypothetical protein [Streptomyces sp. LHD-70]MDQ8707882.1 hypothetical protein [Streptomyces sp. LHD-70]